MTSDRNERRLKSSNARERSQAVLELGRSPDNAGAVREIALVLHQDPDQHVRIDATVALGRLGGPDATALLVDKAASSDERIVRIAALEAIETSRDPSAVPGVINLFRLNRGQDDVVVQIGASEALLKIGASGVPQLIQALSDPSSKVRAAVVDVLGRMGNPQLAGRITGLRADPDSAVRRAVEGALATLDATTH